MLQDETLKREEYENLDKKLKGFELKDDDNIIAQFETIQYPEGFDFKKTDDFIIESFRLAKQKPEKRKTVYRRTIKTLIMNYSHQIKLLPNLELVIKSAAYEYFSGFEGHNVSQTPFSTQIASILHDSHYMKQRVKDTLEKREIKYAKELAFAFRELYENASIWGNQGDLSKPIHIGYRFIKPFLIGIQDNGEGFNPDNLDDSMIFRIGGNGLKSIKGIEGIKLSHYDKGRISILDYTKLVQ